MDLNFFDDFDEKSQEISDSDSYDDRLEANDPLSPIWDGSEIHYNHHGIDPAIPDWNEVNQD